MSRYITNYTTIQSKIKLIKEILNTINIQDITRENIKMEFLRYKKNFSILEDIIENIEPELLNGKIDGFTNSFQNSYNNIKSFKTNNAHAQYITEANNYLDNMSSFVRPYILHRKRLKNSLGKAIEEYINSIEEHLHNINDFKNKLNEAQEYKNEIKIYHDELLKNDDEESIKFKIDTIFKDIEDKKEKIYNFYNELLIDKDSLSIKTEIFETKDEIEKTKEDTKELQQNIEEIFTNSSKTLKELKEFYIEIFGELDEETENRIGGLQQEIKKRLSEIDAIEERHKKTLEEHQLKYEALEKQINSLLPGATSVGLAKIYSENRDKFEKQTQFWNWFFIGMMGVIFVFGMIIVLKDINFDISHILKASPLYISIIWLALFSSKRRNESMRLEQEYTHKETLAKSYMSYKEQIESLDENTKNDLLQKLLESTTATISQNPNHVLDKNNTEHHPAIELFNNIWKKKYHE